MGYELPKISAGGLSQHFALMRRALSGDILGKAVIWGGILREKRLIHQIKCVSY